MRFTKFSSNAFRKTTPLNFFLNINLLRTNILLYIIKDGKNTHIFSVYTSSEALLKNKIPALWSQQLHQPIHL